MARQSVPEGDLDDWDPLRAELGRAIRQLRVERGWRQKDLEERSGVDQTSISRVERGRDIKLRLSTLLDLLRALRVDYVALDSDTEAGIAGFMRRSEREALRAERPRR